MGKDIFQRIERAGKPSFSDILSKSFELFKKVWKEAFYHVLITIAILIPFLIIIYVPLFAMMGYSGVYNTYGYYEPFDLPIGLLIVYAIIFFALIFIIQGLSLGIIAHFFKVCKKEDTGSIKETGSYFVFLKGKNLKKVMVLSLATVGISLAAVLLCYLPIFYVMVPLQLFVVIFAFNEDLSVSDIIKASFKMGNKYWLITFGLIILSSLIAQIGIIFCFVGVLFTAFFVHIPIYYLYKDTVGFDDDTEEFRQENSF